MANPSTELISVLAQDIIYFKIGFPWRQIFLLEVKSKFGTAQIKCEATETPTTKRIVKRSMQMRQKSLQPAFQHLMIVQLY